MPGFKHAQCAHDDAEGEAGCKEKRKGAGCDIRQVVCEWERERERESTIETSQGGVVAFSIS